MMTITFLYNIFLLILFSIALTSSFALFIKSKRKIFLYISLLLLLFILDNTIIYMTEFLQTFRQQYNNSFMSVPAFKTTIVLGTAYLYYAINSEVLQIKKKNSGYFVLLT
ncbi:MAG: helix-turn-helix transcriptional regulator, partial [Carnobacterium sp.]|nr:helix-turn-helix transcriptional regulator [Carnobacterium sp.]